MDGGCSVASGPYWPALSDYTACFCGCMDLSPFRSTSGSIYRGICIEAVVLKKKKNAEGKKCDGLKEKTQRS